MENFDEFLDKLGMEFDANEVTPEVIDSLDFMANMARQIQISLTNAGFNEDFVENIIYDYLMAVLTTGI